MRELHAEFRRRISEIHGIRGPDRDEAPDMIDKPDVRHLELQAMVDVFLGEDYDPDKVRMLEELQIDLRRQHSSLYQKLRRHEITPEAFFDATNEAMEENL